MRPEPAAPHSPLPPLERGKFLAATINGIAIYVLAYYLVWGLHDASKVAMSHVFQLRGHWDPSRVVYTLGDGEWWRSAIIGVYGAGPLACLVLGLLAFRRYWHHARAYRGQFKLLLLWVAFHSCNAVFGALLGDTFTESGFWYVPEWLLQVGNVANVLFALLAGLAQLALGYFGAIAFLQAHDSHTVMRYDNRQKMVFSTIFLPWLVGSVVIALLKVPYLTVQEFVHLAMMGLLVTPLALACRSEIFSQPVRRPMATHIAWGFVVLALVVAVTWRLALSPPVSIG